MPSCNNCNPLVLRAYDVIISCFVITPLTIVWWAGTWQLLDIYLYPQSTWISYWISLAIGSFICIAGYFINPILASKTPQQNTFLRIVSCRLFNYIFSHGIINFWRGIWEITDDIILKADEEHKQLMSAVILAISIVLLILLRAIGDTLSLPFCINTEFGHTFHLANPRFRSRIQDFWWYTADVFVSHFLICTLVIQVWRGIWNLTTHTLSPDYHLHFQLMCAAVGLVLCLFLLGANYPIYKLAIKLHGVHTLLEHIYEVFINLFAAVAGLILWVACWQMLKEDVLGSVSWRGLLFHFAGFVGLLILQASSTLVPIHCHLDGEKGEGHGVWWHIDYVTAWRRRRHGQNVQLEVQVADNDVEPLVPGETVAEE